jgi:gliding motility-associated-like protein
MKTCRLFSFQGAMVVCLIIGLISEAEAQTTVSSNKVYNSEALWSSYNHNAFQKSIQNSLGVDAKTFDAFQKFVILQKESWRDRIEFFTKAKTGQLNPLNINAYFEQLKAKYISYYPEFKTYQSKQQNLVAPNPKTLGCGSPCTNPGFETNDFTNWTQQQGSSIPGLLTAGVSLSNGTSMTSITNPGPDPTVAALNQVYPGGGTHSAMIGDGPTNGGNAGALSTSFTVSATTTNFTYSYAVVLQDGGHSATDQPFFMLNLTDQNGNVTPCGSYEVTAGANIPNFYQVPGTFDQWYRPWTTMFVDLTPYIGQCVTMQFICRDCDQGGHYGYAYVDASCAPAQIVTSSPAICGSSTITLTAPPGASAYAWTGPGIVGANNTQVISINVAGTYTVVMTSAQGGCTSTLHITVPGNPSSPIANFTATTACAGNPIQFTDLSKPTGGIKNWAWDFNADGVTDDTTQNPSHAFPAAGTFPVHLTITWPPCVHDTIINVTVTNPPIPAFTFTTVCVGTATSFASTPANATSYFWDFGDGTTSAAPYPAHIYTASGTYSVTLTVVNQGCTGKITQNVNVITAPAAAFSATEVCQNLATVFTNNSVNGNTYSWTFGDASTSTLQSPTHTYAAAGTYTVSLVAISAGGCTNKVSLPVKVDAVPLANFSSNSVCVNSMTQFKDSSFVNAPSSLQQWTWNFGDGSGSALQNPSHLFATAGTHTIQLVVSSNNKCADTVSKVVTVYALPVAAFAGDSLQHCTPWCVNFKDTSTANGGAIHKWTWNFGDNTPSFTQTAAAPATHCYKNAGTYDVKLTVTSDKGCVASLNKPAYVTTWPLPEAEFSSSPEPTTVLAPLVQLTDASTGAVDWHWDFGDKADTTGNILQNPSHSYPSDVPGTYPVQLIVRSIHGCLDTVIHPVTVGPVFDFYAPNCFTPNADGVNDYFFGYGVGIATYELIIVDRWGNQLWKTHDLYEGWDGKVQGSSLLCQIDVYVWKVYLTDVFGIKHSYIGRVSLVR